MIWTEYIIALNFKMKKQKKNNMFKQYFLIYVLKLMSNPDTLIFYFRNQKRMISK